MAAQTELLISMDVQTPRRQQSTPSLSSKSRKPGWNTLRVKKAPAASISTAAVFAAPETIGVTENVTARVAKQVKVSKMCREKEDKGKQKELESADPFDPQIVDVELPSTAPSAPEPVPNYSPPSASPPELPPPSTPPYSPPAEDPLESIPAPIPSPTPWWSRVWAQVPSPPPVSAAPAPEPEPEPPAEPSAAPVVEPEPEPTPPPQPAGVPPLVEAHPPAVQEPPATTAQPVSSVSWLTPWAWSSYQTTTTTTTTVKVEETSEPEPQPASQPEEIHKEEPVPPAEDSNPITATITTNRSGWASFFTSRSLLVKSISNPQSIEDVKRDENGVEVMEIPDDEDRGRPATTVSPPPAAVPITIKTTKPSGSGSSTPVAASPSTSVAGTRTPRTSKSSLIPSKMSRTNSPVKKGTAPSPPNLVLPTWEDTFHTAPRSNLPPKPNTYADDQGVGGKIIGTTMKLVGMWKGKDRETPLVSPLEKEREQRFKDYGKELPKAWKIFEDAGWDTRSPLGPRPAVGAKAIATTEDVLRGCRRAVIIGIHGWFPGAMIRTMLGEPTGTSGKFANMMEQALLDFEVEHNVKFDKVTKIPLEGEGTIEKRVERLYANLVKNEDWMEDLHAADAILVATHSQGSVVSTHLLDRLIREGHIVTHPHIEPGPIVPDEFRPIAPASPPSRKPQRVCCLALCGIHLGPLRYLSSSTLVGPYLQYFESLAARELFEFQNTESRVSREYIQALENVLESGVKMVYVASLNDQVVPMYSGLFVNVRHPGILRSVYIDGDAYHSSDFLANLLVLLIQLLNAGITDSGLIAHLSEATAGSLNGVGHSTAYEEPATYALAVKYLFLTTPTPTNHPHPHALNGSAPVSPSTNHPQALHLNPPVSATSRFEADPFNAANEQNDYEIPWALRDIIADERVAYFFGESIKTLKERFREWTPKTSALRDVKRKLAPIQRLGTSLSGASIKSNTTGTGTMSTVTSSKL